MATETIWKETTYEFKFEGQEYRVGIDRFGDDLFVCTGLEPVKEKYLALDSDYGLVDWIFDHFQLSIEERKRLKVVQRKKDYYNLDDRTLDSYTQLIFELDENGYTVKMGYKYDLVGENLAALGFVIADEFPEDEGDDRGTHIIGVEQDVLIPWEVKQAGREAATFPSLSTEKLLQHAKVLNEIVKKQGVLNEANTKKYMAMQEVLKERFYEEYGISLHWDHLS